MKKLFFILVIILAVVSVGVFAFKAEAISSGTYDNENYSYFMPGMRGAGCLYDEDETWDYDFLYIHLGDEDRATIDLMYAAKLAEYDFQTISEEEQLIAIETIKDELATYIIEQEMPLNWYAFN